MAHCQSNLHLTPWPRAIGVAPEGRVMSQFSKMKHSRTQWKEKAKQRGQGERYERREKGRIKAERDQLTHALNASQARVRELEARLGGLASRPKVDVVHLALQLFLEARISFRAVSRVLALLALALGIKQTPCPQTIINWVIRLTIVRLDSARTLRGLPLDRAPFSNGLIWMIDISIGLGSGKILAVLAFDAHHHQLESEAPTLRQVHCSGVAVATSWNGDTLAAFLTRRIATLGRPVASLKDNGSDRHQAGTGDLSQSMGRWKFWAPPRVRERPCLGRDREPDARNADQAGLFARRGFPPGYSAADLGRPVHRKRQEGEDCRSRPEISGDRTL